MKHSLLAGIGFVALLTLLGFLAPFPQSQAPQEILPPVVVFHAQPEQTATPQVTVTAPEPRKRFEFAPLPTSKSVAASISLPETPHALASVPKWETAKPSPSPTYAFISGSSSKPDAIAQAIVPLTPLVNTRPYFALRPDTVLPTVAGPVRTVKVVAPPLPMLTTPTLRAWEGETRIKVPTLFGANTNATLTVNVGTTMGANTFYTAGYNGLNAHIASIEGGTAWRGHETTNWIPSTAFFTSGLAESSTLQDHATAVTMTIAGKGAGVLQQGIAFGIGTNNMYLGNIATSIGLDGSFSISLSTMRTVFRTALITGVNGDVNNRVDVTNSSYGSSTTPNTANLDLETKIIDGTIFEANNTRGATVVFSAGNEGSGVNTVGAPGIGFNVLTVGALGEFLSDSAGTVVYNRPTTFSSRSATAFNMPTSATDSTTTTSVGNVRARVDIVAPGLNVRMATFTSTSGSPTAYQTAAGTSFSSPAVAGGIGLLADYARTAGNFADPTFATDGRLIKAVILNSADKTSGWTNAQTWNGTQWSTTQSLDFNTGAGKMNLDQAFRQYTNSVANPTTQLLNPAVAGTYNVNPIGWARTTLDRTVAANTVSTDFIITNAQTKFTELNTTLSWYVNRTSTNATSGTNLDNNFHNLDLEVWKTDGAGVAVTRVAQSNSTFNNTEHLSFLLPSDGQYLVRVLRQGGAAGTIYTFGTDITSDIYGLAWLTRPGLVATTGTTAISANTYHANMLIAPDIGQTAGVTVSVSGTKLSVGNQIYVGGNDTSNGGTATLTLDSGTSLEVSNKMTVFSGGTVNATAATLGIGVLTVNSGGAVSLSGSSFLTFAEINLAGSIAVPSGALIVRTYTDSNNSNAGRLNLVGTANSLNVTGTATVNSVVTGSGDLVKTGNGTLTLAPNNSTRNTYTGTTRVNAGTLSMVANFLGLPTGNNIVIEAGANLNTQGFGNSSATAIGSITLNGGTFRAPSGVLDVFANIITFNGGSADFTGTTDYWYHARNTNAAINSLANATTATWIGAATSRVQNDTAAALPVNIAAGTTASGIDLDASVIFSNQGTNVNFSKNGTGTLRLTNTGNTASFTVNDGRLRTDTIAQLGSGAFTLNGGTYTYGGATASGTKAIEVSANSNIEVLNAGTTLTFNGTNQINYNSNTISKTGPGTLTMSGTNTGTSSAGTTVVAGVLRVTNVDALPSGSAFTIQNNAIADFTVAPVVITTVNSGGTLVGVGSIGSGGSLAVSGTISPGSLSANTISTFDVGGDVAFHSGGRFIADVNQIPANGTAGTNWDQITSFGTLNGTATSASRFNITFNALGSLPGFDNTQTYTWSVGTFATANTLSADAFSVTTGTGWTGANSLGAGSFIITTDANLVSVVFTPVPEPGSVLGFSIVVGAYILRRRKPRHEANPTNPTA